MRPPIILIVLMLVPRMVWADPAGKLILQRAIDAHGGKALLESSPGEHKKLRGNLRVGDTLVPFTSEIFVQAPEKFKCDMVLGSGKEAQQITHLLHGEKTSQVVNGKPQPLLPEQTAHLRSTLRLERIHRMASLITDPEWQIQELPRIKTKGRSFSIVQVKGKDGPQVKLFFDDTTGFLVKSEMEMAPNGEKPSLQEAFFGEYRSQDGIHRPGQIVIYRNGVKTMEAEVLQWQRLDPMDDSVFQFKQP